MTKKRKQDLIFLWMAGLILGLVGYSVEMSWQEIAWFAILLIFLFFAPKWLQLSKLEPAILLVLVAGILLVGEPQTFWSSLAWNGVGYLLCFGGLTVIVGLLTLGWKRPVGGVVDLLIFGFCLLFPLAVLVLQGFVSHYFKLFPIQIGVKSLTYKMLTILAGYVILTQFILQDEKFRQRLNILYLLGFIGLGLVLTVRVMTLEKSVIELEKVGFKEGPVLDRALFQANLLNAGKSLELIATQSSMDLYRQGKISKALALVDPIIRTRWQTKEQKAKLLEKTGSPAFVTLAIGSDSLPSGSASMVAMTLDTKRGRFFLLDNKSGIYVQGQNGLECLGIVNPPPDSGSPVDLLWREEHRSLRVLFKESVVMEIDIGIEHQENQDKYRFSSQKEIEIDRKSSARKISQLPGSSGVVIGYGDFEVKPIIGQLPDCFLSADRPLRQGKDLLRDLCFMDEGLGGYILDAFGGIHPFGYVPIQYKDLQDHKNQKYHFWPGQDIARAISCSEDGRYITVFDAYGGVHGIEKLDSEEKVHYFGSIRAYFDQPEILDLVESYGSYYLLHSNGRIDRRAGEQQIFSLFRDSGLRWQAIGLTPLFFICLLGWLILRSPHRVPR